MAIKKTPKPQTDASVTDVAKAAPYPFLVEILLEEGVLPIKGKCLKATDAGFLMRVEVEHHFKVGDNHQARFNLPGNSGFFNEPVKVVKTYDALGVTGGKKLTKNYLVEMHFRSLRKEKREQLLNFMKAIGQT